MFYKPCFELFLLVIDSLKEVRSRAFLYTHHCELICYVSDIKHSSLRSHNNCLLFGCGFLPLLDPDVDSELG